MKSKITVLALLASIAPAQPRQGRVLLSDEQFDAIADASHELPQVRGGLLWGRVMNIFKHGLGRTDSF